MAKKTDEIKNVPKDAPISAIGLLLRMNELEKSISIMEVTNMLDLVEAKTAIWNTLKDELEEKIMENNKPETNKEDKNAQPE